MLPETLQHPASLIGKAEQRLNSAQCPFPCECIAHAWMHDEANTHENLLLTSFTRDQQ